MPHQRKREASNKSTYRLSYISLLMSCRPSSSLQFVRASSDMSGLSDLIEKVDFSITTWLAFGATLQLLGLVCLPTRIVAIPPLSWLLYRLFKCILDSRDVYKTSFTDTVRGARTARLPGTSDGVVVFVLGSRVNQLVHFQRDPETSY